ncbi:AAA family ATPase [Leptospira mayottensis]|uniref:AAA family ATPase n=1 Tax=Leptospira mayottensis TaxID=1137606 RepID=UPI000E35E739|nr:AAA family ATPase [Leptospira mayottensis]AXR67161.1 AAA family ATPase [Leptospira mayottensis]
MINLENKIIAIETNPKGYKSLKNFKWENIPDFAVITGLNGSGKTQLLEALNGGKEISSNGYNSVKSNNITLSYKKNQDANIYYIDVTYQPRLAKYSAIRKLQVQEIQNNYYRNPNQTSKTMTIEEDIGDLDSKIIENLTRYFLNYIEDKSVESSGKNISLKNEALNFFNEEFQLSAEEMVANLNDLINKYSKFNIGYIIIQITLEYLDYVTQKVHNPKSNYNNKINLDDTLSRLFVIHHKCKRDLIKKIQQYKEQEILTIEEAHELELGVESYFYNKEHPCKLINNILNECRQAYKNHFNLKYNIDYDRDKAIKDGEADIYLTDLETNEKRDFTHLSSGEKIIISLLVKFFTIPKLDCVDIILVDEFDAFLNPQMASMYTNIMYDIFYMKYGKQVILTTHSPSTISYVPEENLFWMEEGRIHKEEKMNIIHKLAFGYLAEEDSCPFNSYLIDPRKPYYILVEGYTDILHFKTACRKLGDKYEQGIWNKCNFISLGGTKEIYAKTFISNFGHGKKIISIFDNDKSGNDLFIDLFKNTYDNNKAEKNIKQINKDSIGLLLKPPDDINYSKLYKKQITLGYITIELLYPKAVVENFNIQNNGFIRKIENIDDLKKYYSNPGIATDIQNCFVIEKDKLKLQFAKEYIKNHEKDNFIYFQATLDLVLNIIENWEKIDNEITNVKIAK